MRRIAIPALAADGRLGFVLYLPAVAPRALVLCLHGSGERGIDLDLVEVHGLPRLIADGLEYPAVVLAPQCPEGDRWTDHLPALHTLTLAVAGEYGVDPSQLAVTGLSLGGEGAYRLVMAYPQTFARAAPICGPGPWHGVTPAAAAVPTWVFHGDADDVVPVDHSLELVEEIRRHGGDPRLTIYRGVGHASWRPAYEDAELLDWLVHGA